MPEARNRTFPSATHDIRRTRLMTGASRATVDPRRMRGANKGLKKILIEGMTPADDQPHRWKDFSGAMVRHAVDEAMRTLPAEDKHVVKLAYFGGCSNREIARHVGLTEVTVQRRLRRALGAISEFIQHGHALRRRALYALTVWLSGRWLSDSLQHIAQTATVAAAAAIIVSQPAPQPVAVQRDGQPSQSTSNSPATLSAPMPSPTAQSVVPAAKEVVLPAIQPPALSLPVQAPPLPVKVEPPPLPIKVEPPPLPIKVEPPP